mmetsp:Transcript_16182/g.24540  ORF Transcript_16182/g.24540 Transcript_16182/m.24540 type:complete len:231 (+) Transcript_16182:151-843(+)
MGTTTAIVFAFLGGALVGVLFLVVFHRLPEEKAKKSVFHMYLNVLVLNREEVIQKQVKEKVRAKQIKLLRDRPGPKLLRNLAGSLAGKVVTDEKFSAKMGKNLSEKIPNQMAEMGITATAELLYVSGPYLVVVIHLHDIDISQLVEKKSGEKQSKVVKKIMGVLGKGAEDGLEKLLVKQMGEKLKVKLPKEMKEKMKNEKGLEISIEANGKEDQADYFFDMLATMDAEMV